MSNGPYVVDFNRLSGYYEWCFVTWYKFRRTVQFYNRTYFFKTKRYCLVMTQGGLRSVNESLDNKRARMFTEMFLWNITFRIEKIKNEPTHACVASHS